MQADAQAIIANLPPGLQAWASLALFVVTLGLMAHSILRGKARAKEEGEETPIEEILESSPIRDLLGYCQTMADNARLQTEALKVSAAGMSAIAKLVEQDFDERRVHREVERRLAEERARPR